MDYDHKSAFLNNLSHNNITRQYNPWLTMGGGGGGGYWCIPNSKHQSCGLLYISIYFFLFVIVIMKTQFDYPSDYR